MVVAARAVLVAVLKLAGVFPEAFLALLAGEYHFEALQQRVVSRLGVALCAVEPFFAARRADRDLGVEDVFAAGKARRQRRCRRGVKMAQLTT